MELYDALASNTEATRLDAAKELVKKILEGNKTGNAEKGAELTYALNRLVKGLTSGRESARIGFSIALTEVMLLIWHSDNSFCQNCQMSTSNNYYSQSKPIQHPLEVFLEWYLSSATALIEGRTRLSLRKIIWIYYINTV